MLSDFAPVPTPRCLTAAFWWPAATTRYCPIRLAGAYARAWGSEFVRLQNAGHINVDSGHGEWPLGRALLQSLTEVELALAPTPAEELAQGAMI